MLHYFFFKLRYCHIKISYKCCNKNNEIWNHPHSHRVQPHRLTHLPLNKMAAHLADDTFNRIFVNEKLWILIKNSLKFVPKGPIDKKPALVQVWLGACSAPSHYLNQCWHNWLTHICGTRGRWVKGHDMEWPLSKNWENLTKVRLTDILSWKNQYTTTKCAGNIKCYQSHTLCQQWPLLPTWFNCNPSMDKSSQAQ